MKKTKLTRSLLAACSIVALSAVMYGCVHNGGDDAPATDMSGTPDPVPEPMPPEPAGPTDLEDTQTAAAGAAAAAMTASTNAAASASSAADATMTLATLQTGADSNSDAMGGREAAYAAHAAAGEAADAASEGRGCFRGSGGGDDRRSRGSCLAHGVGCPGRCRGGRGDSCHNGRGGDRSRDDGTPYRRHREDRRRELCRRDLGHE